MEQKVDEAFRVDAQISASDVTVKVEAVMKDGHEEVKVWADDVLLSHSVDHVEQLPEADSRASSSLSSMPTVQMKLSILSIPSITTPSLLFGRFSTVVDPQDTQLTKEAKEFLKEIPTYYERIEKKEQGRLITTDTTVIDGQKYVAQYEDGVLNSSSANDVEMTVAWKAVMVAEIKECYKELFNDSKEPTDSGSKCVIM